MAATDLLSKAVNSLEDMVEIDPQLQPILDLVNNAILQINEAAREINYYGDSQEADPDRLSEIEERIRQLKLICRKYGPSLGDVLSFYDNVERSLLELSGEGDSLESLERTYQEYSDQLMIACQKLRQMRQTAANQLEKQLIDQLRPLAMEKVKFQVKLSEQSPTVDGADRIDFLLSPNVGEELQPLASTASGGEMSRFLLALKACFSQTNGSSTLIFDEIDVGVSGQVAQAIAEKLYQLSTQNQLLCVTHQPLVAVMADHHWRVSKRSINLANNHSGETVPEQERTIVEICKLETNEEKQREIAQLAGGKSAQEAYDFASSLLIAANKIKSLMI